MLPDWPPVSLSGNGVQRDRFLNGRALCRQEPDSKHGTLSNLTPPKTDPRFEFRFPAPRSLNRGCMKFAKMSGIFCPDLQNRGEVV